MRVLFVTHAYPRRAGDGAGAFVHHLATSLRDHDVEVRVLAPSAPGLESSTTIDDIRVDRFRYAPRGWETLAYEGTMAEQVAVFSDQARDLAARFWPGPLTLVLPARPEAGISDLVTAGLATVAVRMPAHPVARALLAAFGGPLAAPSANPSGKVSPTEADHVLEGLSGRIAAVVDGGACPVGVESTILGLAPPVLLRPGGVDVETLEEARGVPHSLMVGKTGKPVGTFSGMPRTADLVKALDQLIQ